MARTLAAILTDVNSYIALDASVPTGTDVATWTDYANLAVSKAAAKMPWDQFNELSVVSTGGGTPWATLASVSLPSNFREFTTAPQVNNGSSFDSYVQIHPLERYSKQSGDRYCYVLGNPSKGYTAVFNALAANATLYIDYQRFPSGFATLTDTCELDDDTYIVEQVKSYVLQARSDDRFPVVEDKAVQILDEMQTRQDRPPQGGINKMPHVETYRIGD